VTDPDACAVPDLPSGPTPELVVITGMSGAGRSEAIHTFEDLGYFCVDNLPPGFIPQLVDLAELPGSHVTKVAVVCDPRSHEYFDELAGKLDELAERGVETRILYLEADDEIILRRFNETRRRHPMCADGEQLIDGIRAERDALADIRARADLVVDTGDLKPRELRETIRERFLGAAAAQLAITVMSFGFKYGAPTDADIVMDVRFLPNPHYLPELRPLSGLQRPVREYVIERPETEAFLDRWFSLLEIVVPGYVAEGKHHLTIALGCTGGMHRSVALAEATALYLQGQGYVVATSHRDLGRDLEPR
jgi:UPF0042 nucleotide-binding protein